MNFLEVNAFFNIILRCLNEAACIFLRLWGFGVEVTLCFYFILRYCF